MNVTSILENTTVYKILTLGFKEQDGLTKQNANNLLNWVIGKQNVRWIGDNFEVLKLKLSWK